MKNTLGLFVTVAFCSFGLAAASPPHLAANTGGPAIEIVGEDIFETYASPSPYAGVSGGTEAQLIWSDVIHHPKASYICPHFGRLDLAEGDFVVVRSPDGTRTWRYEGSGVDGLGVSADGFWGIHITGDTAVVELWSAGPDGGFGYVIDRYARGFSPGEAGGGSPEAIIGADDSEWARCYETTDPDVYATSRAVARLLINGSGACTGWLVGNEGHLLTNEHCITSQAQASNTNYEFMAEGATCATNCNWWFACPGTIVTTSGTLIADSYDYDYALVQLSVNPSSTYGYFTLRADGGVIGERLYIPQHPAGWGKRIALYSSHPSDPGHPVVVAKNYGGCGSRPGPDMGYRADTQGGSSGSPVVAYDDHQVIALHHCGSSTINTGVLIEQVIAGLGGNLPANAFGDPSVVFVDDFESGNTGAWAQASP